ncbi:MAG TPA: ShlB/FhaC/HecB family hemolysin secretion/activation protein, partial [Pedomonas sp.]|nr:ShlB/FhaC/HecB family hemolysin secretion/activation protein [Pedomonas sp.]
RATFSASSSGVGASTMTVLVNRDAFYGKAGINNHLTKNLGRTRMGGSLEAGGLLNGGDGLRLDAWRGVSNSGYLYLGGSYSQMLGADGLQLGMSASYSNSEPEQGQLADLDYLGKHAFVGASLSYPLIRARQRNFSVGGAVGVSNSKSSVLDESFTEDRMRTLSVNASYDFAEQSGAVNLLRGAFTQGLGSLGATADDDPLKSRANGSASFSNLELTAIRNQPLGGAFSLYLQAHAQAALGDPVLSAAECTYGGRILGRGYDTGAINGDHCVMAGGELRWFQGFASGWNLQLYGFADIGKVFQKGDLLAGEERSRRAVSWGGGMRTQFGSSLTANLEVAEAVHDEFRGQDQKSPRIFFSITSGF